MQTQVTNSEAIKLANLQLKEGFTIAYMNRNEIENFIWGYLYNNKLQYKTPIDYVDEFGNKCSAIVYQNKY